MNIGGGEAADQLVRMMLAGGEVAVRLIYPEGGALTPAEGVEVRMTNSSSGTVTTAATDASGIARFRLAEGIYESAATDRRSLDGYTYTLNALKSNIVVSAATLREAATIDLELVASRAGQILIKEVYSGGCQKDDGSGTYQFDKYMIVCNNSDQPASIRNFCIGMAGRLPEHRFYLYSTGSSGGCRGLCREVPVGARHESTAWEYTQEPPHESA